MTGNISAFADNLADGAVVMSLSFLGLVAAFICGASIAALLINAGKKRNLQSIYALAITVEAFILLLLGTVLILSFAPPHETILVIILSFIMGLQNAVTTMISRARVRTTHVSGMATDIGIELVAIAGEAKLRHDAMPNLKLHSLTLASFTIGGVCGAILFQLVGSWLFVIAASVLLLIAVPEALRAHRS